jgi:hypothetical protein
MTKGGKSRSFVFGEAATEAEGDVETASHLAEATGDAQAVLGELRQPAHGIHPAILTEAGLGPALASLADSAPVAVEIGETNPDSHCRDRHGPRAPR